MSQCDAPRFGAFRERPLAISVFGVLNVALGALGGLGNLAGLAILHLPTKTHAANLVVEVANRNPVYSVQLTWLHVISLLAACGLIAAGLGLLRVRPWGRWLSIGCGLLDLAVTVLAAAANAVYLLPAAGNALAQHTAGDPFTQEEIGRIMGGVVAVFGNVVGIIYPIVLLAFMFLPSVAAALRARAPCPPDRV